MCECRCFAAGGSKSSDPCTLCPAGTFSANKGTEKCVPCRFGYTSPEGAEDEKECYPVDVCPAGTGKLKRVVDTHPSIPPSCTPQGVRARDLARF